MDNTTVQFLIKLKDEFSGTLKNISGHTEKMNQQMEHGEGLVKKLGAALAGFFAIEKGFEFGSSAVEAYNKHAQAAVQLETSLKSTHGAIGLSMNQLNEQAEGLSNKSLFEKTDITHMQGILATFTQVKGVIAREAQPAILDLAQKMGGDLQGATVQLGKALNDPIRGITALRRVGVSFTESQMNMIKALVASNHTIDAQKMILKELQTEFGGSAEAATKVGTGPLTMMKKKFEEVKIEIGELIMRGIGKLLPYVEKMIEYIKTTVIPYMESWKEEIKAVGHFLIQLGEFVKAHWSNIKELIIIIGAIKIATLAWREAQLVLNAALEANPYVLVATAIGLIALKIWDAVHASEALTAANQTQPYQTELKVLKSQTEEMMKQKGMSEESARAFVYAHKMAGVTKNYMNAIADYNKDKSSINNQNLIAAKSQLDAVKAFGKGEGSLSDYGSGIGVGGENPSFQPESLVKEKLTNITINITEMNGIKSLSVAGLDEGLEEMEDKIARMLLGLFEAPERMLGAHV